MGGLGALQKRLLLILNPAAGMRKANRFLVDIIALFNSNGYVCTVFCTARQGHAPCRAVFSLESVRYHAAKA